MSTAESYRGLYLIFRLFSYILWILALDSTFSVVYAKGSVEFLW